MIWKTYCGCILINMVCVNAWVHNRWVHNRWVHNRWTRVDVNNRQIIKPYLLDNDIEVYEALVINGVLTHESLRAMDRVFVPEHVCKIVKGSILLISGCVIIVLCK